jgi:hypothetical protein
MTPTKPIHTLNARGHVMLEVMRDYFKLSPARMQREIQGMRLKLEEELSKKGISYARLKSALVPDRKRREIALVFNTLSIESGWYGYEIFQQVIPLLDKKGNHSILHGDYLDRPGQAEQIFSAFEEAVQLRRSVEFRHPTQFFIVYLNNLTEAMVCALDRGLSGYEPYVGYADTTYASRFKFYLSTMLSNLCVKHGSIIIQGHEPDRDDNEDVNMSAYPFEESGYTCRSVNSDLEGVLLSYKIERPVIPGFEVDTEFGLNAISTSPLPLDDFEIEVQEARLEYVKANKTGSVERAGLEAITAAELAELIKAKISASYIYNLEFLHEHNVAKFNLILELASSSDEPTRLLAALEYRPEQKSLKLLTLF